MKNYLRKMAGAAISLILVFMVIAVLRYTKEEDTSLLEGQYELTINESWNLVMVNGGGTAGLEDQDRIRDLVLEELVQGKGMEVDLPYAGTGRAGDIYVFTKELPDIYMGHVLNISSTDVAISVVLDGKVIYCYGLEEGDDTGSSENFVSIPNVMEEGEVWIELAPLRSDGVFSIGDVKVETRDVVVIGVVGNSITDIGCCLLIVIMAIIMFVLALIRRYTGQPTRGEFFWGSRGWPQGYIALLKRIR